MIRGAPVALREPALVEAWLLRATAHGAAPVELR